MCAATAGSQADVPWGGGCRGENSPPGVPATWIARAPVVQTGQRCPAVSANVRRPAAAQVHAVKPFALDGLPGTTPAGHSRWSVVGRAFCACCFASKLRSPAGRGPAPRWSGGDPYAGPYAGLYAEPYAGPYARHSRTPSPPGRRITAGSAPSGEWCGRAARSASRGVLATRLVNATLEVHGAAADAAVGYRSAATTTRAPVSFFIVVSLPHSRPSVHSRWLCLEATRSTAATQAGEERDDLPCLVRSSQPVVALKMSLLPKADGQSPSGQGAGNTWWPASKEACRQASIAGQSAVRRTSVHTPAP
jgi:hypothetical protein